MPTHLRWQTVARPVDTVSSQPQRLSLFLHLNLHARMTTNMDTYARRFIIHAAFTFVALCGVGLQALRRRKQASAPLQPKEEQVYGTDKDLKGGVAGLVESSSMSGDAFAKGGRMEQVPPI